MAPLQKRAWYGLVIGICLAVVILILFLLKGGISRFDADQGFRLTIDILWIAGLVTPLVLFQSIMHNPIKYDERDKNNNDTVQPDSVAGNSIFFSCMAYHFI